ncbi:GIY-YIG nuclease family protein [Dactylosporangium cerinum]|uniref:GIY-YIG nuclease family protein n=1 Tax=Dactylosporangium cerinum TaxID=1434730 RepID=A0ABV9VZG4_9ACTN
MVDGTPQGLRVVERAGWTGSCLAFARADYPAARARREVQGTGVYVLVGPDPDGRRTQRVYVGEADEVRVRLDSHQREKDFWTHGFVLSTKDDSLNKAHVRYLEARLLEIAREADNATLDNGTAPPRSYLSESETADMESYLDEALVLFPLVGVNVFDRLDRADSVDSGVQADGPNVGKDEVPDGHRPRLSFKAQLTAAEGREDARGFLVYEGATGPGTSKVMSEGYQRLRERLLQEGILVAVEGGRIRLTKDYIFESPSAAASVLSGGSKNGRIEWRDGTGRTLKEVQRRSAPETA